MKNIQGKVFELEVVRLNSSGQGIAFLDKRCVFIDNALVGEIVEAKIVLQKRSYLVAQIEKIIETSPHRIEVSCPYYKGCGGCQIMHLDYPEQLQQKTNRTKEALKKIGRFQDLSIVEDCIASPEEKFYRNKVQMPVRNTKKGLGIGFFQKASHSFIEIEACEIQQNSGNELLKFLKQELKAFHISAYSEKKHKGLLRNILIRSNLQNQLLLIFVTNGVKSDSLVKIAENCQQEFTNLKGVLQNINEKRTNTILGEESILLSGEAFLTETINQITFQISEKSFFQINSKQATQMFQYVLENCNISKKDIVLDAYSGTGTIALQLAEKAKKIFAIESNTQAIEDAKINQKANKCQNVEFIPAKSEDAIQKMESLDLIIIDPPRKGCEPSFLEAVIQNKAKKFIYISCDPATFARDLRILVDGGFELQSVQPFDMFPQTMHVENIAILTAL